MSRLLGYADSYQADFAVTGWHFAQNNFIMSWSLAGGGPASYLNVQPSYRRGSYQMEATFSDELPFNMNVVILAEGPAVMSVTKDLQVSTSYRVTEAQL